MRPVQSIRQRWQKQIEKKMKWWAAAMEKAQRERKSGQSDEDVRLAVEKNYFSKAKSKFPYAHLYEKCKKHPKWMGAPTVNNTNVIHAERPVSIKALKTKKTAPTNVHPLKDSSVDVLQQQTGAVLVFDFTPWASQ